MTHVVKRPKRKDAPIYPSVSPGAFNRQGKTAPVYSSVGPQDARLGDVIVYHFAATDMPTVAFRVEADTLPEDLRAPVLAEEGVFYDHSKQGIEYHYNLWDEVQFTRSLDVSVRNGTGKAPTVRSVSVRPRTALVRVRCAPNLQVPSGSETQVYQTGSVTKQRQIIESFYGKIVTVIHRSGTITGVIGDITQVDDGAVVDRNKLTGVMEGVVSMQLEITETQVDARLGGGLVYEIGRVVFPRMPDPATGSQVQGTDPEACVKPSPQEYTSAFKAGVEVGRGIRQNSEAISMYISDRWNDYVEAEQDAAAAKKKRFADSRILNGIGGFFDGVREGREDPKYGDC